jgi:hypothetical protein
MPEEPNESSTPPQTQPGQVIAPGGESPQPTPTPEATVPVLPAPPAETNPVQPNEFVEPTPVFEATLNNENNLISEENGVTWEASEFIAHDKSASWFVGLAVAAVILAAVVYIASKDIVSTGVIIIAAIIFGVYGNHKPRQMTYQLSSQGIAISNKVYSYDDYKSFSIRPEGSLMSLTFMPLKRFSPPLTIYYNAPQEESIMKILTARMPYEEPRRDTVDSLMKKIRF